MPTENAARSMELHDSSNAAHETPRGKHPNCTKPLGMKMWDAGGGCTNFQFLYFFSGRGTCFPAGEGRRESDRVLQL
jgi:hypothetical protein